MKANTHIGGYVFIYRLSSILFVCISIFTGCNINDDRIKNDCEEWYASHGEYFSQENMKINKIYKCDNQAIVFYLNRGEHMTITTIILGDIKITSSDTNFPLVWHKGDIFELTEAYEKKILSVNDAKKIKELIEH